MTKFWIVYGTKNDGRFDKFETMLIRLRHTNVEAY